MVYSYNNRKGQGHLKVMAISEYFALGLQLMAFLFISYLQKKSMLKGLLAENRLFSLCDQCKLHERGLMTFFINI